MPADSTGIGFINKLTETERFNQVQYLYYNNGAGVAAGDVNNDGLVDLYFTASQEPNKLYLNKGNFKFEDITDKAGVSGSGDWKTGVTMADVNGDGFLDIYVCQVGNYKVIHGRNQLFINQGDLTFRDEAKEYGLDFRGFSTQAAFFDYDIDGDLDMYLLNHSVHTSRSYGPVSLRFDHDSLAGDRLYRNDLVNGKRFFTNVTGSAGIYSSQIGYGLAVNTSDINNDGLPDIYISNDFHESDYLYINNGNGSFTDKFSSSIQHTSRSSMGNDVADFNNDGLMDIMVLDMLPEEQKVRKRSGGEDDDDVYRIKVSYGYGHQFVRNMLHINLGGGIFSEIGRLSGIFATDWSWAPLFCDIDNDGLKDIFITTGIWRRSNNLDYIKFMTENEFFEAEHNKHTPDSVIYQKMPLDPYYNYIYRNNGDLTFTNKATEWGIKDKTFSNGSAYADLDNDGDMDLVVNNINDHAEIYRNGSSERAGNNFLTVELKGKDLNTRAVGTHITLYYDGRKQVSEQFFTRGFMSASCGDVHFGLGDVTSVDSLVVRWPDLSVQVLRDVPAGKISIDINEAVKQPGIQKTEKISAIVSPVKITGLDYRHIEDEFETFKHESLVPHTLFSEGPALVAADFNGDGLEDLLAGSAKGHPSVILIQQTDGSFKELVIPAFIKDLYSENVDAAAFDADGDKDIDLYIVRGGSEVSLGDPMLEDLLLINDGTGGFTESAKGSLPVIAYNGSCVAPCDFDNDGDMDLFVGSRSVPGAYGLSARQLLLENDGHGKFADVTEDRMKKQLKAGMVTAACWIDYDKDGDQDLILAGEWMKVMVLNNENGEFTDKTITAGLEDTSGWWSSIESADVDNDGDIDLIAGNSGLNFMLKPAVAEPVGIYLNDFDKNGTLDQVISSYQDGVNYPVAWLEQISGQISGIAEKFSSHSDYAASSVMQIFGRLKLGGSVKKNAVLFESCVFLNNGNGAFDIISLPMEAQFSPIRDILIHDFNNDNISDLALVGNNYTYKPTYGRQDASYGWIMTGDGKGGFSVLRPVESGFIVNGDARKIVQIDISGKDYLLVGVNDNNMQVFECLE